ncbi:hypothetical protein GDO81_003279 [Engystomops pustulosus]|uniref:Uncharacterized protein n=1 Tax=Engystomops pustulosus TaxID=76066 RepID=A0AAV7A3F8_ENGPU|nr:hypothetical protein GDO81_003279 [Engystomops pustulosus]
MYCSKYAQSEACNDQSMHNEACTFQCMHNKVCTVQSMHNEVCTDIGFTVCSVHAPTACWLYHPKSREHDTGKVKKKRSGNVYCSCIVLKQIYLHG